MKLCLAQTIPKKGNISANIENHKKIIRLAVSRGANVIIFPELSLTGYEPALAKELATTPEDIRFYDFQYLSDEHSITIGVGIPTKNDDGICISMILFHPLQSRQVYSKQYLHEDEEPYFVKGENAIAHIAGKPNISLAICYELSIPQHSADACHSGAEYYIASVAKSKAGVEKASQTLAEIAKKYSMAVMMSNCVGPCDNFESAGKSAIWNKDGELVAQLNEASEGLLILDTDTSEAEAIITY